MFFFSLVLTVAWLINVEKVTSIVTMAGLDLPTHPGSVASEKLEIGSNIRLAGG